MEEYIKLPMTLGLEISKILTSKYNIEPRKNKYGMISLEFSMSELNNIEEYKVINPSRNSLDGIEYLRNLKSLTIETLTDKSFKESRNIASISSTDALRIEMLPNLKELKIINQNGIKKLDLSRLPNLEQVIITDNANLESLKVHNLAKLNIFHCFNNKQLLSIPNLNELIKGNSLDSLLLDFILFSDSINYEKDTYDMDMTSLEKINDIKECIFIGDNYITILDALRFHQQAISLLDELFKNDIDDIGYIVRVDDYLAKNIVYDNNATLIDTFNSSRSNSEGFCRCMQYLLKLNNIKSHLVYCLMQDDYLSSKHKIIDDTVLNIDSYYNLYCDPCGNSIEYQCGNKEQLPYTLINKDEIFRFHTLSLVERNTENNHLLVPRNIIDKYLNINCKNRGEKNGR